ncbi:alpha/beta hydrolase [Hydrocarboniphaga sp.]|uniref:alpha/beta hydrolase n=1 Tax=Hydrocarboniphaga sp. TaxID=2033016 RepID=UPI003D0EE91B
MFELLKLNFLRWLIRVTVRYAWRGKFATDVDVSDETMPVDGGRIRLRIYKPRGKGPFPVLLFFHGGGWVGFDLDTHDALCRDLCVQAGHLVVSVEYRLAPEHPFPIPVQDCLASLQWMRDNVARLGGDPARITLCGDSAGGNLAAVAAQQARALQPGMIKGQVLIYPVTDHGAFGQWPSYREHGGPKSGLPHVKMVELWDLYLRGSPLWTKGMRSHDLATPLHVADLSALPRSLFVLAEDDLLRDEGLAYAERLQQAGVEVQVKRYPGQVHGFVGTRPTAAHREAVADIAGWLRGAGS